MNRVVVKIGGSLIDAAEGVLNELLASGVNDTPAKLLIKNFAKGLAPKPQPNTKSL